MLDDKLEALSRTLGHRFNRPDLLRSAITHRSRGGMHNERLEFLGDSILNFTIAAELYHRFPKAREGDLTRMRALLVRGETLAQIARDLSLGEYLHLGLGERKSGGQQRESILADALEAIIGALYLEGGLPLCRARIMAWFESRLDGLTPGTSQKDAKTRLQEYLQSKKQALPEYQIVDVSGDPHNPIFKVQCTISILNKPVFGMANSRRKAEQAAADQALEILDDRKS